MFRSFSVVEGSIVSLARYTNIPYRGTLSTVQDSEERRERVRKSSSAGTFMASHPLVKEVLIIGGEGMNIVNDINYMMNFYGEGGGAEKLQKLELTGIVSGIHCNEFNKFI
jgi:hypothetical protein